jgi:hypothetical protein
MNVLTRDLLHGPADQCLNSKFKTRCHVYGRSQKDHLTNDNKMDDDSPYTHVIEDNAKISEH